VPSFRAFHERLGDQVAFIGIDHQDRAQLGGGRSSLRPEELAQRRGGVAVVVDAEALANGVDRASSRAVGEQPAAPGGEGDELLGVGTEGAVGEEFDGRIGDGGGGVVDRGQQVEDPVGRVAGGEGVDRELQK